MRVAYVCADPGVPVFGCKGCSVHVQEMMRAFVRRGADVELFATRVGGAAPVGLTDVRVHKIAALPTVDQAERERVTLAANDDLATALERGSPFDLVYERHALFSYAGVEHARHHAIPGVLEVNAPLIEEQATHRGLVDRHGAEIAAERAFAASAALLAVSKVVAAYLEDYPGARGRVHVVPNAVDPQRFSSALQPSCLGPEGHFTIGFVGTLKPWHGLSTLVEAFAREHMRDPAIRLLIVGDGPERAALEADISARRLSQGVHFTGLVRPDMVPPLLASMDAAVASYPDILNFYFSPLKVYEYMAARLPVIASRVGELTELIEHEINGLLYPARDAGALADAIGRLRRDATLRSRLGHAARATVLRKHTWDQVVDRIHDIAGLSHVEQRLIGAEAGL